MHIGDIIKSLNICLVGYFSHGVNMEVEMEAEKEIEMEVQMKVQTGALDTPI